MSVVESQMNALWDVLLCYMCGFRVISNIKKVPSRSPIFLIVCRLGIFDSEWSGPRTKKGWITFLQNISDKQIVWFTPWLPHVPLLYRYGDKLWIPLSGLWGAISYAPLMVVRQFAGKQFIPTTGNWNN